MRPWVSWTLGYWAVGARGNIFRPTHRQTNRGMYSYIFVVGVCLLVVSSEGSLTSFYHKFSLSKRLVGHTLYNMTVRGPQQCIEECVTRKLCQSVNFNKRMLHCELRTSTANKFPAELVHDPNFDYLDIGSISYVSFCSLGIF